MIVVSGTCWPRRTLINIAFNVFSANLLTDHSPLPIVGVATISLEESRTIELGSPVDGQLTQSRWNICTPYDPNEPKTPLL